jgi:hypothetical protein
MQNKYLIVSKLRKRLSIAYFKRQAPGCTA